MSDGTMLIPASPGYEWITSRFTKDGNHVLERAEVIAFAVIPAGDEDFEVKPISTRGQCVYDFIEWNGHFAACWEVLKNPRGHCFDILEGEIARSVQELVKLHKKQYAASPMGKKKPNLNLVR